MIDIYNKLVRDKIPEIIQKSGDKCQMTILEDSEFAKALADKLIEEQQEFLCAFECEDDERAVLELVDMVEVCYAVLDLIGVAHGDFEKIRQNKAAERGKFDSKIFLRAVERNEN